MQWLFGGEVEPRAERAANFFDFPHYGTPLFRDIAASAASGKLIQLSTYLLFVWKGPRAQRAVNFCKVSTDWVATPCVTCSMKKSHRQLFDRQPGYKHSSGGGTALKCFKINYSAFEVFLLTYLLFRLVSGYPNDRWITLIDYFRLIVAALALFRIVFCVSESAATLTGVLSTC
jgi:hypothetical protein